MSDSYGRRDQSVTPVYLMNFSDKQDLVIVAPPDERRTKAPLWMPPDDDLRRP